MSHEVDFFISRSGADASIAQAIALILVNEGHTVILQDWDFGHADFVAKMDDAIERAHRTITLLSLAYLKSEFCGAEWCAIFARDPRNFEQELILLRVEHCQPKGLLCLLAYTDLVPVLHDANLLREVLLARVKYKPGPESDSLLASYTRSSTPIVHRSLRFFPHLVGREADFQCMS